MTCTIDIKAEREGGTAESPHCVYQPLLRHRFSTQTHRHTHAKVKLPQHTTQLVRYVISAHSGTETLIDPKSSETTRSLLHFKNVYTTMIIQCTCIYTSGNTHYTTGDGNTLP